MSIKLEKGVNKMGLDIVAYKGVKLVNEPALDEYGDIAGKSAKQVVISIGNSEWEQGDDLEAGQVYTYDEAMSVFSVPCSSFNDLRDELARIAGYEPIINFERPNRQYIGRVWNDAIENKRGLLYELLNFADNEGEVGTKSCRKILNDLHTVSKRAGKLNEWDQGLLTDLIQTFEFAAVDGFVQFR